MHAATLLSDGKVLIMGGLSGRSHLDSAVIYDPQNDAWSPTATMSVARGADMPPTATVLRDGGVLVAGGGEESVEIFDLSSGSWSLIKGPPISGSVSTATLLQDGRVLVSYLSSEEMLLWTFDPSAGTWNSVGAIGSVGPGHTATPLLDGTVLFVGGAALGGSGRPEPLASTWVFDAITGEATATGNMNRPRFFHTATRLNDGRVLVIEAMGDSDPGLAAEIYGPNSGTWSYATEAAEVPASALRATPTLEPTATFAPTPTSTAKPAPSPTTTPTATPTPTPVPLTEVYRNDALGYSIAYPSGWSVLGGDDAVVITDLEGTSVVITGQLGRGSLTTEAALSIFLFGFQPFEETSRTKIESPTGYLLEGEGSVDGRVIRSKILFTTPGDRVITVVSNVPEVLAEQHQPRLDAMFGSFDAFTRTAIGATATATLSTTTVTLSEVYTSETFGYSIAYPSAWTLSVKTIQQEEDFVGIRHDQGTNIAIFAAQLGGFNLDEFTSGYLVGIGRSFPSFTVTSRTEIDSPRGYLVEADVVYRSSETGKQRILVTSYGDYAIVASTNVGEQLSELHQPMLDAMLASFETVASTSTFALTIGKMISTRLTEIYTNANFGYSIAYPNGWSVNEDEDGDVFITHPSGTALAVLVQQTNGRPLEDPLNLFLGGLAHSISGWTETSRTEVDSPPSYVVEARTDADGPVILQKFLAILQGDNVFFVFYTVAEVVADFHQPILHAMLGSFETRSSAAIAAAIPTTTPVSVSSEDTISASSASPEGRARARHTATLLDDGRVLVVGGVGGSAADDLTTASADLYDPSSGTWVPSAGMAQPREEHAATLLLDGRVLVVGGLDNRSRSFRDSAELYDPAGDAWSLAASMTDRRSNPTITLLQDGRVLIVGGGIDATLDAEIYDPSIDEWSSGGSMAERRSAHTAASLVDGRVLVAGGIGLSSTGIYDRSTGDWTSVASMKGLRSDHTATLLEDGTVLVTGGWGIDGGLTELASAEVYNPTSDEWSIINRMSQPRVFHTATMLRDGRLLVIGGASDEGSLATGELYDSATHTWSSTGSMVEARTFHRATLLPDGKVLVTGGYGEERVVLSSAEIYDPATGTWSVSENP